MCILTFQKKELSAINAGKIVFLTDIEGKDDRKQNRSDWSDVAQGQNATEISQEHYSVAVHKIQNAMFGKAGVYRNSDKARNTIRVIAVEATQSMDSKLGGTTTRGDVSLK